MTADDLLADGVIIDFWARPICPVEDICFELLESNTFQLHPELPVGTYQMTLRGGESDLVLMFELRHSTDPWIQTMDPGFEEPLHPGMVAELLLSGFAPNQTVPLGLYVNTHPHEGGDQEFEFVVDLGGAVVNEDGWSYFDVILPKTDPATDYYCITSPDLVNPDCSLNYGTQAVYIFP
jgi:hypothetical protein